jgi:hypothetical protein
MVDLLPVLFPILLVDVLNPVLFATLVFAAGSNRTVANSAAILAGHTLAYFVAGVAIAHGLEQVSYRLANPQRILCPARGRVVQVLTTTCRAT